jgi:hypothetical protein
MKIRTSNWAIRHKEVLSAWSSIVTIISLPLALIGLVFAYFQIKDLLVNPSIQLEFVHPTSVAYYVKNTSKKLIEKGLISFALFDLDSSTRENPNLPAIVPIPSRNFDYLNQYEKSGPTNILGHHGIAGHRYFGIIYASCKGCNDLKTYWIYCKHNSADEAFYASRTSTDTFYIEISELIKNADEYLKKLVPEDRRIYIRN